MITLCPRSLDQFYKVTYIIKWVKTSWTDSNPGSISSITISAQKPEPPV